MKQLLISSLLLCALTVSAQNSADTTLNRNVTVERDFQPVIQAAGKLSTKPEVVETTVEAAKVEYSDYTADVQPGAEFNALLSQPTRFSPGKAYNGYLRGAIGHPNTLFDFEYKLDDGKKSVLNAYAHHDGQWGLKADSKTKIGLEFAHLFSACDLYFGVNGSNTYVHKYGHFYDYNNIGTGYKNGYLKDYTLTDKDKVNLWSAEAYVGVKSNAKQEVQYKVQTGYLLFAVPGQVNEHQLRSELSFDWSSDAHHVGAEVYIQNNFRQLTGLASLVNTYHNIHNFRIEPYYAYKSKRVQLHLGINLDMNLGRGQYLSGVENLSFAPSPHVYLEAQVAKQWLTIYADAKGSHGIGTLQSHMDSNPFRLMEAGVISGHVASYTPIDAEVGFHIRPYRDLMIELHGGYAHMLNQTTLIAVTDNTTTYSSSKLNELMALHAGDLSYTYSDYSRGKIGGQINYHYKDIIRINLHGDYYFWNALKHEDNSYNYNQHCQELHDLLDNKHHTVYDRANWEIGLRIDGRIDKHWSLYSDNYFGGSRLALATDGTHKLKPTIELDLGVQYEMWVGKQAKMVNEDGGTTVRPEPQPNLTLFFELNNFIHRKNDIYYGYQSQGINFRLGAIYKF